MEGQTQSENGNSLMGRGVSGPPRGFLARPPASWPPETSRPALRLLGPFYENCDEPQAIDQISTIHEYYVPLLLTVHSAWHQYRTSSESRSSTRRASAAIRNEQRRGRRMFTTIISLAGLAASAYLGRRELSRRKASGERSGLGWAVAFCVMQLIAALLAACWSGMDSLRWRWAGRARSPCRRWVG